MIRLFLSISKGEELRFLGHLDYLRTMERAIMRSGLPVAFSEGFNPHMKISMDSALGVGVTADPLYMEMDLEREVPLDEVKSSLTSQLPGGISINGIIAVVKECPKLSAIFNEDVYQMEGPVYEDYDAAKAEAGIQKFNDLSSFIYKRVTPKKVREMDVKPMILEPLRLSIRNNRAYLTFSLVRSTTGTVQSKDIWKMPLAFPGSMMNLYAQGQVPISAKGRRERHHSILNLLKFIRKGNINETDSSSCRAG